MPRALPKHNRANEWRPGTSAERGFRRISDLFPIQPKQSKPRTSLIPVKQTDRIYNMIIQEEAQTISRKFTYYILHKPNLYGKHEFLARVLGRVAKLTAKRADGACRPTWPVACAYLRGARLMSLCLIRIGGSFAEPA
jgi:hypothetical protein